MYFQKPYFKIEVYGELAYVKMSGEWTVSTAIDYHNEVIRILESENKENVVSLTDMRGLILFSPEVSRITNMVNQYVAERLNFKHDALIVDGENLRLIESFVRRMNLKDTDVEVKAFKSIHNALHWLEDLSYDCSLFRDNKLSVETSQY